MIEKAECEKVGTNHSVIFLKKISGTIQGALHTALHATYHISRTLHHVPHNLAPHTSYHVPRTTYTCQACQQGHKQQYLWVTVLAWENF